MANTLSYCFDQSTFMSAQKVNPSLGTQASGSSGWPETGRGEWLSSERPYFHPQQHPVCAYGHPGALPTHTHTHTHACARLAFYCQAPVIHEHLHLGPLFLSPPTGLSPTASFLITSIAS